MSNAGPHCIAKLKLNNEQGLTLLEVMIALTVWAMLLPVIAGGLLFTVQAYTRACERLEAREQALAILRKVEGEVRGGHSFVVLSNGLSFLDSNNRLIQYQLTRTGSLQRVEAGIGSSVIGVKVTACRWSLESPAPLLHLQLSTEVGHAHLDLEEWIVGQRISP